MYLRRKEELQRGRPRAFGLTRCAKESAPNATRFSLQPDAYSLRAPAALRSAAPQSAAARNYVGQWNTPRVSSGLNARTAAVQQSRRTLMAEPHIGSLAHFPPVRQQCVRE